MNLLYLFLSRAATGRPGWRLFAVGRPASTSLRRFFRLSPVLLLLILASACSQNQPAAESAAPPARPPLNVRAVQVTPSNLQESVDVTGSLVSTVAVEVRAELQGRLVTMSKQEGDAVTEGELLAQLDDSNAQLAVAQADANLEVAEAMLERARLGVEHARVEQERAKQLARSGGITEKDSVAADAAAGDAAAQVKVAEAQITQSRQAAATARKRLSDSRILSPISGTVERRALNPGSYVEGTTVLYRLVDNRRLELEALVASSEMSGVRRGQEVLFTAAPFPDRQFSARITHISAAVQPASRSVMVRATAPNPEGLLRAGMFFKGKVVVGVRPNALKIPAAALWRRSGRAPAVFVIEQNQARRREVVLGQEEEDGVVVNSGLSPGDWVIIEQNLELSDGVAVASSE